MEAKTRADFLMSPTVDYCFKELLAYPEIRKGFVAAILNQEPLIIKWMRFLSAESREEFEKMAGEDNYINEAYEVLQKLSADERKRLEYEARQKAILDYNFQMSSSREEGIQIGEERGKIGTSVPR